MDDLERPPPSKPPAPVAELVAALRSSEKSFLWFHHPWGSFIAYGGIAVVGALAVILVFAGFLSL